MSTPAVPETKGNPVASEKGGTAVKETRVNRLNESDRLFVKGGSGGPGRPKGGHNKDTLAGHRIKAEIFAVWNEIDGPKLLAEWGRANFADFARLIVPLIPRETLIEVQPNADGQGLRLVFNRAQEVLDNDSDSAFIDGTATDDGDNNSPTNSE
ncbi:MAG: hypothetical protein IID40_08570 [Planctomycetes bacterium]|nr:hypothetical protein [Planctomycetota bacterium]